MLLGVRITQFVVQAPLVQVLVLVQKIRFKKIKLPLFFWFEIRERLRGWWNMKGRKFRCFFSLLFLCQFLSFSVALQFHATEGMWIVPSSSEPQPTTVLLYLPANQAVPSPQTEIVCHGLLVWLEQLKQTHVEMVGPVDRLYCDHYSTNPS